MPKEYIVNVSVATVWTSPGPKRVLDEPSLKNPVNIEKWLKGMTTSERSSLCDDNLIQTQVLYGERVVVINTSGEWAEVVIPSQPSSKNKEGYPGWIPSCQLQQIDTEMWNKDKTAVVTSKITHLLNEKGTKITDLSYLTELPVQGKDDTHIHVLSPHGTAYLPWEDADVHPVSLGRPKENGENIIKIGKGFVGLPYLWGGLSAFGYDCSGFSYSMHKAAGYQIPRDAGDQAKQGQEIPFDLLMPGDLLFFAYEEGKGKLHHVGIYYGQGKMLHSPHTGKNIEILTLDGTVYEKELCNARRYWHDTEEPA
ncbi:C40 family peptidase [Thalassobacillus pellis]|uniref:C40 family peptidase n=1 Tax=Thalassobacillus pellis TaxID=748008 RepID=UPI00195F95C4|nr:C40 family peptidase [Thalassobacillus pellis]MBM7552790.1 cell wall-associated NlpC family hydrolase [Thalassobacillus pellis]